LIFTVAAREKTEAPSAIATARNWSPSASDAAVAVYAYVEFVAPGTSSHESLDEPLFCH
jgi:hypothetical protein